MLPPSDYGIVSMHWACLYLPHLALDAVLRNHPDPERPLVLVTGPTQKRVLAAVNPAAQAAGLRPGMGLASAQAIVADFGCVEYDPAQAEHWRQFLAAWAYRFSSQVCTAFDQAIVLEVEGSLRLFGPWPRLRSRLRDELQQLGFRHHLVAAPNPFAARVLANAHADFAVGDGHLHSALGQLPLEHAGLDPAVVESLSRMGLRRLQQVLDLPRPSLAKRFSSALLHHLDELLGTRETPLTFYRPPDRFDLRMEFDHEIESSQALLFPLRRLTGDLAAYLAGRDGGVQHFDILLEHESVPATPVRVGLLSPQRESAALFEFSKGRLEAARVPAPVRGMRLVANELPPFVPASRDLFDLRPAQAIGWDALLERLRARLGDESVCRLTPFPDHRPEQAWRSRVRESDPHYPTTDAAAIPARPAWLLQQPVLLRDTRVEYLNGPERIESGWWDGDGIRRDYYRVRTSQGQQAWVWCPAGMQPGADGFGFMLHGWFA